MEEHWIVIKEHPNYSVSPKGEVRNDRNGKILKQSMRSGYLSVSLGLVDKTPRKTNVHVLVAETFLGQRRGMVVNHIDGDPTNNSVSNLEIVTRSQNSKHAWNNGLVSRGSGKGQFVKEHDGIPIPGFSKYCATKSGEIINARTSRVLKQPIDNSGYARVPIYTDEGKRSAQCVHRLIAAVFVPNPENKKYVRHVDGDKTNNHYTNLEWSATPK